MIIDFVFLTCFLSLLSRWSILTLDRPISVLEPKTWLPSCWSTIPCTDCPSRESWATPGWSSAPPRSPQPWTMKSPADEHFSFYPPNMLECTCEAEALWSEWLASVEHPCAESACITTLTTNHFTSCGCSCLQASWASWLSFSLSILHVSLSYQWHSFACKYFTVYV